MEDPLDNEIARELLIEDDPNISEEEIEYLLNNLKNPWDAVLMRKLLRLKKNGEWS